MNGRQIQAARALLGWSQAKVADAAGVSVPTVKRVEGAAQTRPSADAVAAIRAALETAGITFTDGGVALGGQDGMAPENIEQALAVAHEINTEAAKGSGKIDDTDARIQRENLKLFLWKMKLEIVSDEDGRERLVLAPLS